jgi:ParB/RepB/Spo0J family partition protein
MFNLFGRGSTKAPDTLAIYPTVPLAHRADDARIVELPLDLIDADPENGRGTDDEEGIQELADSIRQQGVIQPVVVRPVLTGRYKLIAGERRCRGAIMAGLTKIPALVKDLTDDQATALQIIENEQRKDIDPVVKALKIRAFVADIKRTYGSGAQQRAAEQLGKSQAWVSKQLALLDYPEDILSIVRAGKLRDLGRIAEIDKLKGDHRASVLAAYRDGTFTPEMMKRPRKPRAPRHPSEATTTHAVQPAGTEERGASLVFALPGREAAIRMLRASGYAATLGEPIEEADDARLVAYLVAADGWLFERARGVSFRSST